VRSAGLLFDRSHQSELCKAEDSMDAVYMRDGGAARRWKSCMNARQVESRRHMFRIARGRAIAKAKDGFWL
jgi:hypothetical protein